MNMSASNNKYEQDTPNPLDQSLILSTKKTSKSDKKQLKVALALSIERSRQLKQKLNKFLSRQTSDTQTSLDSEKKAKSNYSGDSDQTSRTSLDEIDEYFQVLQRKSNSQDPAKEDRLQPLIRAHSNLQKEIIEEPEPINYQTKLKRNSIYGHESYKQQFQEQTFNNTIEANNRMFEAVFLKKTQIIQSIRQQSKQSELVEFAYTKTPQISINDFTLMKKLGAGKSGEVFLARHKHTKFICAIKRIKKTNIDIKNLTQMIREIKIQSFLSHPNIAQLYGFLSDYQCIYLIMQYCVAGDLYSLLKQNTKLPQETVKDLITQISCAINYIHLNNIIHRDLKPQNILYQHGMAKICDFGWSISSTVTRQTFCGTPLYVSPELLQRESYGNKIDVWSIGILTYQLIFGRVPFDIFSQSDLVKIIEQDIKFLRSTPISKQAKNFISSCLQKDPRARSTVVQLLQHPFLTLSK